MLPVPIDTQLILLTSIGHVDNKGLVSADILVWLNVLADYCQLDALLYMYMCNHAVHGAWASGHKNKRRRSTMQVCFSCGNIWSSQEFAQGQVFLWNVTVCVAKFMFHQSMNTHQAKLVDVAGKAQTSCWVPSIYWFEFVGPGLVHVELIGLNEPWPTQIMHHLLRQTRQFSYLSCTGELCFMLNLEVLPWQLTTLKTHFKF